MVTEQLVSKIGTLVNILQAIGIIVLLYIIFGVIDVIINRKRLRELQEINKNVIALKKVMSKKK